MVNCAHPSCSNGQSTLGVVLHRFPSDPAACQKWVTACGDIFQSVGEWKSKRLCEDHFAPDQYEDVQNKRVLKRKAVPTRNVYNDPDYDVEMTINVKDPPKHVFVRVGGNLIRIRIKLEKNDSTLKKGAIIDAKLLRPLPASSVERMIVHPSSVSCVTLQGPLLLPTSSSSAVPKATLRAKKLLGAKIYFRKRSKLNRTEKILAKAKLAAVRARHTQVLKNLKILQGRKISKFTKTINGYEMSLKKLYSPKQVSLLLQGRKQAKWTPEEIGKAITMRYKSNLYEFLRRLGHPYPATRTLQRYVHEIDFQPGPLHSILHMLKHEFANKSVFQRQAVLAFDEIHLQGEYAYDDVDDRIYGPSSNIEENN